jgi:ABC-2 type transport system permease protein
MPLLTLIGKLLRDLRMMLVVVAFLLGAFQCLWAKITARAIGKLVPLLTQLAGYGGLSVRDVERELFKDEGQVIRTLIGGEGVDLQNAMDMLTIGFVHPLMQTLLCIWAVGRAAGAVAGEIDRGTMELLLAQPLARWRLIAAHFCVDLVTIPILCLSMWAGNGLGAWIVGNPIPVDTPSLTPVKKPGYVVELGPFKVRVDNPLNASAQLPPSLQGSERLRIHPEAFGPALWLVGGLIFAVCGATMWLSAASRSRWRVLGVAVFVVLVQFLVNLIGQMWEVFEPLRPLTIFYYYQPQQVILGHDWNSTFREWNGGRPLALVPMPVVLYGVGLVGYLMAGRTLSRRDLPAPL